MHGRRQGRWVFLSAPPVTIHSVAIGSPKPSVSLAVTYRGSPLIRAASTHEHFGMGDIECGGHSISPQPSGRRSVAPTPLARRSVRRWHLRISPQRSYREDRAHQSCSGTRTVQTCPGAKGMAAPVGSVYVVPASGEGRDHVAGNAWPSRSTSA